MNNKNKVLNLCAIYVVLGLSMNLINGFTGLFSSIREDEIAAESMGISLFKHKVIGFTIGAFLF